MPAEWGLGSTKEILKVSVLVPVKQGVTSTCEDGGASSSRGLCSLEDWLSQPLVFLLFGKFMYKLPNWVLEIQPPNLREGDREKAHWLRELAAQIGVQISRPHIIVGCSCGCL